MVFSLPWPGKDKEAGVSTAKRKYPEGFEEIIDGFKK